METYKNQEKDDNSTLNCALIVIGIGLGLIVGNLLDVYTPLKEKVCYFSMVFLFSGLGLFIADKIDKKKHKI